MASRNTTLRIFSAVGLGAFVFFSIYFGQTTSLIAIGLAGVLVLDEITTNFLRLSRYSFEYLSSWSVFVSLYYVFLYHRPGLFQDLWIILALCLNLYFLYFLFGNKSLFVRLIRLVRKNGMLLGTLVFLPFYCFATLVHFQLWQMLIVGLILIGASTDVFAWMVGKQFGKTPLWPSVSPNKTLEGAWGGVVGCLVFASLFWLWSFGIIGVKTSIFFIILSVASIFGDLIQSKIKRRFNIKDSSTLIPGHGGVYDRVDSHLFVAPFFLFLLRSGLLGKSFGL